MELWMVVSHPPWLLKIKPWSSAGAANTARAFNPKLPLFHLFGVYMPQFVCGGQRSTYRC